MDYKKSKAPTNTVTRNIVELSNETGNIYESVCIIAKRSNQIAAEIKQDLQKKLAEFFTYRNFFLESCSINVSKVVGNCVQPVLLSIHSACSNVPTSNHIPYLYY